MRSPRGTAHQPGGMKSPTFGPLLALTRRRLLGLSDLPRTPRGDSRRPATERPGKRRGGRRPLSARTPHPHPANERSQRLSMNACADVGGTAYEKWGRTPGTEGAVPSRALARATWGTPPWAPCPGSSRSQPANKARISAAPTPMACLVEGGAPGLIRDQPEAAVKRGPVSVQRTKGRGARR
jgi:hypothetical protein